MTSALEPPATNALRWVRSPAGIALGVVAALVVAFALGASWGTHRAETGSWHTGRAQIGAAVVSIEYGGWTYGASDAVPSWLDDAGTWHDGGWPECLRPVGAHRDVRFQARTVTVGGTTTRPIIAVDCSGSAD